MGESRDAADLRQIPWLSWRNIVFTAIEFCRTERSTPAVLERLCKFEGFEHIESIIKSGTGAIVACPHCGNWEMAAVATFQKGIPLFTVSGNQSNQLVDRYLYRLRTIHGMETIPRNTGLLRGVVKRLKSGQVLAMLPDVRSPDRGVLAPFLNGEANVPLGMAIFSRLAKVPIVPCVVKRKKWLQQHICFLPPVWPDFAVDKDMDSERVTRDVMHQLDAFIQANPGQWFWYNKRWILDPIE